MERNNPPTGRTYNFGPYKGDKVIVEFAGEEKAATVTTTGYSFFNVAADDGTQIHRPYYVIDRDWTWAEGE